MHFQQSELVGGWDAGFGRMRSTVGRVAWRCPEVGFDPTMPIVRRPGCPSADRSSPDDGDHTGCRPDERSVPRRRRLEASECDCRVRQRKEPLPGKRLGGGSRHQTCLVTPSRVPPVPLWHWIPRHPCYRRWRCRRSIPPWRGQRIRAPTRPRPRCPVQSTAWRSSQQESVAANDNKRVSGD